MNVPEYAATVVEENIVRLPVGIAGADSDDDIRFTHSALDMIDEIFKQNNVPDNFRLRIIASGGGCSGMQYEIEFDDERSDSDQVFDVRNIPIIINSQHLFYMMGVTVDYQNDLKGQGFTFSGLQNMPTCGGCHA